MGERSTTRTDISLYDAIQQTPKPKSKQRSTPFQSAHELEFGLQVSEREPSNGNNVLSVLCRFCAVFGREERVGAKRKKTTNIKYFRRPFRPEHYRKHRYNQHPNKWKQYQLLTEAECKTFFDDRSLYRSNMHLYLNENQAPLVIEVDRAIVEGITDSFLVGDDVDDIETMAISLSLPWA
ncbi:hypothetical protein ON010_g5487 [Phytophthora cinnamomi]|nr:hypothetical protein ON010_g5487 [Phytophthora cinnamomi]